ncbi:hypothetical protein [Bosea sp. BIWAKO-01]|uniref:hypothetical protein n=1 Tax=Bosea sp. BIWAKO-01 TaxID=506668 RepID=UPI000852CE06|nr:hypothetical protein [Bosea sp. BIWAKO-01]GAU86021.1 hypothetical protein BIWAKO_05969 [Bosea sp. BIWAKO-01]
MPARARPAPDHDSSGKRTFAVNLITNSMDPLYRAGKKIHTDEDGRRAEVGDEVLLELCSAGDGEPGPVSIKTLVARGAKTIVVSQVTPAEGTALRRHAGDAADHSVCRAAGGVRAGVVADEQKWPIPDLW